MGKNKSEDNVPRITESPINFSMTVASVLTGAYCGYCRSQGVPIGLDNGAFSENELMTFPLVGKAIAGGLEGFIEGGNNCDIQRISIPERLGIAAMHAGANAIYSGAKSIFTFLWDMV